MAVHHYRGGKISLNFLLYFGEVSHTLEWGRCFQDRISVLNVYLLGMYVLGLLCLSVLFVAYKKIRTEELVLLTFHILKFP